MCHPFDPTTKTRAHLRCVVSIAYVAYPTVIARRHSVVVVSREATSRTARTGERRRRTRSGKGGNTSERVRTYDRMRSKAPHVSTRDREPPLLIAYCALLSRR